MTISAQSTVLVGSLLLTAICVLVIFVLTVLYQRTRSSTLRIVLCGLMILVVIAPTVLLDGMISALDRSSGVTRVMIHPGWLHRVAPSLIGSIAATLFFRWSARRRGVASDDR